MLATHSPSGQTSLTNWTAQTSVPRNEKSRFAIQSPIPPFPHFTHFPPGGFFLKKGSSLPFLAHPPALHFHFHSHSIASREKKKRDGLNQTVGPTSPYAYVSSLHPPILSFVVRCSWHLHFSQPTCSRLHLRQPYIGSRREPLL